MAEPVSKVSEPPQNPELETTAPAAQERAVEIPNQPSGTEHASSVSVPPEHERKEKDTSSSVVAAKSRETAANSSEVPSTVSCSGINENVQKLYLPLSFHESIPSCIGDEHTQVSSSPAVVVLPSEIVTEPKIKEKTTTKKKKKKTKKEEESLPSCIGDEHTQVLSSPSVVVFPSEIVTEPKIKEKTKKKKKTKKKEEEGEEKREEVPSEIETKCEPSDGSRKRKIEAMELMKNSEEVQIPVLAEATRLKNSGGWQKPEGKNSRGYKSDENAMMGSLLFSEESKVVMQHLFVKYPPQPDEYGQLKLNGCSKKTRQRWKNTDGFFCLPSMDPGEIKKKVEALSFKITNNVQLAKIQEQRSKLPITSCRDVILSEIESNQVVLISGETGCGKTTQVPQFLLEKMWESGKACKILCTQPRRISATSVAERVSQERGEVLGETVGYKIRMEGKGGRHSSLLFCTNGILLSLLVSDGHAESDPSSSTEAMSTNLSQLTHIVVDEIHERDHYSDFMLSILREMLPRYPHLRLVLMSATMDAEKFSQYFGGCPVIKVPGFTYPVKTFYLEDVLSMLNSAGKNHIDLTSPDSSTADTALNLAKCAKQTNAKQKIKEAVSTKLTVSSSVQNIDIGLIEQLLVKICTDTESGAILIFFPGWEHIDRTRRRLQDNPFFTDPSKFRIMPLHSMVSSDEQKSVFARPPHGCRKIILSTNIAETAVTIDDVVYVLETGRVKEKNYDPINNVSTITTAWVSKASSRQRAGRAGRCQPGVCYYLYSELQAVSFSNFQAPEIQRIPLEELCLQVKMLDPNSDIVNFLNKTLDPPANETIRNAVAVLKDIGALSEEENLTELGKKLGSLPVHPLITKMLFFAILFKCLDPALTLACAAYNRDPFIMPKPENMEMASKARAELAARYGGHSDQLVVVAALEGWNSSTRKSAFCSENFVAYNGLRMLSRMRKQLQRELELNGYIPNNISTYNDNSHDLGILHALLVVGFYPRTGIVCSPVRGNLLFLETASRDRIRVHQKSAYALKPLKEAKGRALAVYGEIVKGDWNTQVRKCSIIGEIPLTLLASDISVASTEDDSGGDAKNEETEPGSGKAMSSVENSVSLIVDRWLSFKAKALEVAQIYCLRQRLSAAIMFKGTKPRDPLPRSLAASVDALACIFSYDGRTKALHSLSSKLPPKIPQDGDYVTDSGQVLAVTVAGGRVYVTHSLNQSSPSAPTQLSVSTHPSNQSLPSLPSIPSGPSVRESFVVPASIRMGMEQPCAGPVGLAGYGSDVLGPLGPRKLVFNKSPGSGVLGPLGPRKHVFKKSRSSGRRAKSNSSF